MGEDIVATQLVLPAGQILRPIDLGALAACGYSTCKVIRKPEVAILPTGTELITIGQEVKRGDIIEYNSIVMAGMVNQWGGIARRYPITPDRYELIRQVVQKAADENDLVLLNAGSSAGSEDFSAGIVETLGKLLVHGIAVRPGHPVIIGMIRRSNPENPKGAWAPIIGVPGYPVSAALTTEILVEPLIHLWNGQKESRPLEMDATIVRKVTSPAGDDDFMRVVVGKVDNEVKAAPLGRGAGVITSLVRADGIVIIPRGIQGLEAGTPVKVRLYRNPDELEGTIFAVGSHDMTLDVLAQYLAVRKRRLVSSNVGSLGGLVALRRNEAHLAGSHLLDPQSGEYNISYTKQCLPDTAYQIMTWVGREQGLIVRKSNPKNIRSLTDLAQPEIRFINRQRGAGTRVLLDFQLQKLNISPENIPGYEQEEYTHLAVAAAVASGRADCGLGVTAAAQALDLDFVPLFQERYDLIFLSRHLEQGLLTPILDLTCDQNFRRAIQAMPGYDTTQMGKIVLDQKE